MNLVAPVRFFNEARTLGEVLNNIELLFEDVGIVPDWDELGKFYNLPIIYDGFSTILNISYRYNEISFEIKTENRKFYCAAFGISYSDEGKLRGYIGNVNRHTTCMVPRTKSGTWIMNFITSFLYFIGIREAQLEDSSKIYCQKHHANLLLLRIFSGNFHTWYENFGYTPIRNPSECHPGLIH